MKLKSKKVNRKRPMVSATITKEVHERFCKVVEDRGLNKSLIVERAIKLWLNENE